jgi:hypothetical protein
MFVKFPTPNSACKWTRETLRRWFKLPYTIHDSRHKCKTSSKVMVVGQEVMERTNSPTFCWKSTNKPSISPDMYGRIFIHAFIQCLIKFLQCSFLWNHLWTAVDHQGSTYPSLTNNAIKHWYLPTSPHSINTHKTNSAIYTAMKPSNIIFH